MTVEAGPNIVDNGLVLCLDTSNSKSYPGSGTTWTDLTVNQYNATLISSPTYSSSNNGILTFNGSSQYSSVSIPSLTDYSISFWVNVISLPGGELQLFGSPNDVSGISFINSGGWRWHSWSGASSRLGTFVTTGTWCNFIMTATGSTTKFYLNSQNTDTFNNKISWSAGTAYFCAVNPSTGRYLNASLGNISFYNRVLTDSEISQNFNAFRGRYGI